MIKKNNTHKIKHNQMTKSLFKIMINLQKKLAEINYKI